MSFGQLLRGYSHSLQEKRSLASSYSYLCFLDPEWVEKRVEPACPKGLDVSVNPGRVCVLSIIIHLQFHFHMTRHSSRRNKNKQAKYLTVLQLTANSL